MAHEVTSVDELRAMVGHPAAAAANKVTGRLSVAQRDLLTHSPLGFAAAAADAEGSGGRPTRGNPPGFVHVSTTPLSTSPNGRATDASAFGRLGTGERDPTAVPSVAALAKAIEPEQNDQQLEAHYREDDYGRSSTSCHPRRIVRLEFTDRVIPYPDSIVRFYGSD